MWAIMPKVRMIFIRLKRGREHEWGARKGLSHASSKQKSECRRYKILVKPDRSAIVADKGFTEQPIRTKQPSEIGRAKHGVYAGPEPTGEWSAYYLCKPNPTILHRVFHLRNAGLYLQPLFCNSMKDGIPRSIKKPTVMRLRKFFETRASAAAEIDNWRLPLLF